jgi:hypothetical protein
MLAGEKVDGSRKQQQLEPRAPSPHMHLLKVSKHSSLYHSPHHHRLPIPPRLDRPFRHFPFNSHIHTTHLRPSCLRICRPPAATSPSNTSATCPPAVSVPRPTSSWSAPSAPTVSGAWVRVSANKSMLAIASTHLPTSAHLGNTSNGTFN